MGETKMLGTIRATGLSHNVPLPPEATIVFCDGSSTQVKQVETLTPGAYGKVAKFKETTGEKRMFGLKVAVCDPGDDFEIHVASTEPDKQNLAAEIAPGAVDKVIAKARQTLSNGQEWIAMMMPFHPWDLKTFLIKKGPSLTHQERIQILIDVAGALHELNKNPLTLKRAKHFRKCFPMQQRRLTFTIKTSLKSSKRTTPKLYTSTSTTTRLASW